LLLLLLLLLLPGCAIRPPTIVEQHGLLLLLPLQLLLLLLLLLFTSTPPNDFVLHVYFGWTRPCVQRCLCRGTIGGGIDHASPFQPLCTGRSGARSARPSLFG
jgi:hypothetical protein